MEEELKDWFLTGRPVSCCEEEEGGGSFCPLAVGGHVRGAAAVAVGGLRSLDVQVQ